MRTSVLPAHRGQHLVQLGGYAGGVAGHDREPLPVALPAVREHHVTLGSLFVVEPPYCRRAPGGASRTSAIAGKLAAGTVSLVHNVGEQLIVPRGAPCCR